MLSETQKWFSCLEWEYSATSYGKGIVDVTGGTVKSRVYAEVKAKRATVQNAIIDFAAVVVQVVPNNTVFSVLQNDINKTHTDLNLSEDVPRIKKANIVKSSDVNICLITC